MKNSMNMNKVKRIIIFIYLIQMVFLNTPIFALELNGYGITREIKAYGKIILKDNYGPPNYGEDPENDIIETYYHILLKKPLKVTINNVNNEITEMQIIFSNVIVHNISMESTYKIYGNLFLATTGHHHTEVLVSVNKIENVSEKWDTMYNWLIKGSGNYKGQPVANWNFILVLIMIGINTIWFVIKWIKRKTGA